MSGKRIILCNDSIDTPEEWFGYKDRPVGFPETPVQICLDRLDSLILASDEIVCDPHSTPSNDFWAGYRGAMTGLVGQIRTMLNSIEEE